MRTCGILLVVVIALAQTGGVELTGNPPVAEDFTVSVAPGETLALPFSGHVSDPDGDLFGIVLTSGLSDPSAGTLVSQCFCLRTLEGGQICSCSATFTASTAFTGSVTLQFKAVDLTGLESAPATVTIVMGGFLGPRQILEEMGHVVGRALQGGLIDQGLARSIIRRLDGMLVLMLRGRAEAAVGEISGLVFELRAQAGRAVDQVVAGLLVDLAGGVPGALAQEQERPGAEFHDGGINELPVPHAVNDQGEEQPAWSFQRMAATEDGRTSIRNAILHGLQECGLSPDDAEARLGSVITAFIEDMAQQPGNIEGWTPRFFFREHDSTGNETLVKCAKVLIPEEPEPEALPAREPVVPEGHLRWGVIRAHEIGHVVIDTVAVDAGNEWIADRGGFSGETERLNALQRWIDSVEDSASDGYHRSSGDNVIDNYRRNRDPRTNDVLPARILLRAVNLTKAAAEAHVNDMPNEEEPSQLPADDPY